MSKDSTASVRTVFADQKKLPVFLNGRPLRSYTFQESFKPFSNVYLISVTLCISNRAVVKSLQVY